MPELMMVYWNKRISSCAYPEHLSGYRATIALVPMLLGYRAAIALVPNQKSYGHCLTSIDSFSVSPNGICRPRPPLPTVCHGHQERGGLLPESHQASFQR